MKSILEKDWITSSGLRAAVLLLGEPVDNSLTRLGIESQWRCGYVAVDKSSPLFGVDYNQQIPQIKQDMVDGASIGKKSPILVLTACCGSDGDDKVRRSLDVLIDCHGGLTYSSGTGKYPVEVSDLWWFGFDCHHCNDTVEKCTLEYVVQECEQLAKQLFNIQEIP